MKRLIIASLFILLFCYSANAEDIQRGTTFTTTCTAAKLHELIESADVTNIEQTDIKANYGLVVKSSSTPSDTDVLWNDTSNNTIKAYISGSWQEVSGIVIGDQSVTGDSSIGGTLDVTDVVTLSSNCSIDGNLSVNGILQLSNGFTVDSFALYDGINDNLSKSGNVLDFSTDSTGTYTVTFEKGFESGSSYAAVITVEQAASNNRHHAAIVRGGQLANSITFDTGSDGASPVDVPAIHVIVTGVE